MAPSEGICGGVDVVGRGPEVDGTVGGVNDGDAAAFDFDVGCDSVIDSDGSVGIAGIAVGILAG